MAGGLVHEAPVPASMDWYTPAWVFEAIGLTYDLDPCHPITKLPWVPASCWYSKEQDGLSIDWMGRVWLNPPYGKETPAWLARMANHVRHDGVTGIALLFARTDTKWFQAIVKSATAICFLKSRVRFVGANGIAGGSPGCGSMLIAWGEVEAAALTRANLGPIWRLYP